MLSDFAWIVIFFLEDLWESSSSLFRDTSQQQQQSAETWAVEEQSQALSHRVLGGDMEGVKALLHFFVFANKSFWMFLPNILDCAQILFVNFCIFFCFFSRVGTEPEPRPTLAQGVAVVLLLMQWTAATNSHVWMTLCLLPTAHWGNGVKARGMSEQLCPS